MNTLIAGNASKRPNFLRLNHFTVTLTSWGLLRKVMFTLSKYGPRFELKNLGEYHDLYLKMDVLLPSNMFKVFRSTCLANYGLDPAHFYTSLGLAWQACFKKTGVYLELLTDPDMLLLFGQGMRGGITQAVHQYAQANNK